MYFRFGDFNTGCKSVPFSSFEYSKYLQSDRKIVYELQPRIMPSSIIYKYGKIALIYYKYDVNFIWNKVVKIYSEEQCL